MYKVEKNYKDQMDRLINTRDNSFVLIKRFGAEIIGYNIYDKNQDKVLPVLWNSNNDFVPFEGAWKNHATVLFPIVGGLMNNISDLNGQKISSKSNHGFARHSVFDIDSESSNSSAKITYVLKDNEETKKYYPFSFELKITYEFKENDLLAEFEVINKGTKDMYFQIGWHPGFSTDMGLGGKRKDWQIIFKKGSYRQYHVQQNGDSFLTGETSDRHFDGSIDFTDHDLYCTLMYEIPEKENRVCRMYNPKIKKGIEVDFQDFPHLGIWANKDQEYICIEPWQGMDDHLDQEPFDKKVGVVKLRPSDAVKKRAVIRPILE